MLLDGPGADPGGGSVNEIGYNKMLRKLLAAVNETQRAVRSSSVLRGPPSMIGAAYVVWPTGNSDRNEMPPHGTAHQPFEQYYCPYFACKRGGEGANGSEIANPSDAVQAWPEMSLDNRISIIQRDGFESAIDELLESFELLTEARKGLVAE